MAGIKGLKRGERPDVEKDAEKFISGAKERANINPLNKKEKKQKMYKCYTFSLTESLSSEINRMTLVSKKIKINRSDVVKVGIDLLNKLSDKELAKLLENHLNK